MVAIYSVKPLKVAFSVILILLFVVNASFALPRPGEAQPNWVDKNYFAKSKDTRTAKLLDNVERNHFSKHNYLKFFLSGDYESAIGELWYVLWVFPNHPKALRQLELLSKKTGQYHLPLKFYSYALKLYPQYAITYAQFGSYLVDMGKVKKGIQILKKALKIDPKLILGHVWIAKAYHKLGSLEQAQRSYNKAKRLGYKGKKPWE